MTETTLLCILDMDYRRRVRKSALANNPTQASTAEKERRGGGEAYGDQCFSNYEPVSLSGIALVIKEETMRSAFLMECCS